MYWNFYKNPKGEGLENFLVHEQMEIWDQYHTGTAHGSSPVVELYAEPLVTQNMNLKLRLGTYTGCLAPSLSFRERQRAHVWEERKPSISLHLPCKKTAKLSWGRWASKSLWSNALSLNERLPCNHLFYPGFITFLRKPWPSRKVKIFTEICVLKSSSKRPLTSATYLV